MNYSTISAILRGRWLIDTNYAESQLPLIVGMLKNHQLSFSYKGLSEKEDGGMAEEKKTAVHMATVAGRAVYKVSYHSDMNSIPDGSVAFVDLIGPIVKYGGMCSYGAVDKANLLRKIDNAANISGVILNVDSPGGQVDGTSLLADQVKAMSKPVVAMVDDGMMASAAMWIGSSATEIYATKKSDSFGSIGVYATLYDWNAYLKSEGLPVHEIYAPQSEEKNKDYRDALSGDYSGMKADLSQIAETFIETVSTNRPQAAGSKDKWSKGGMFYATEAKKLGLIDGIKSFDQIVERVSTLAGQYSKNNKKNKMSAGAFQNTLAASKATEFAVVDGGFLLTEENLNNIEADLTAHTQSAVTSETAQQELQASIDAANQSIQDLTAERDAHVTRITELEAEVASLSEQTAPPAGTRKASDEFGADPEAKYLTSVDAEMAKMRALRK
jgi:protease-4